jgi:hypothetical protein
LQAYHPNGGVKDGGFFAYLTKNRWVGEAPAEPWDLSHPFGSRPLLDKKHTLLSFSIRTLLNLQKATERIRSNL